MPIKRILYFMMGFSMALGAAVASMPEGATLTPADLGNVPLTAWLLSFGSGIAGALDIQPRKPQ